MVTLENLQPSLAVRKNTYLNVCKVRMIQRKQTKFVTMQLNSFVLMKSKSRPTSQSDVTHVTVKWLTTERACDYLGVSRDFLDNLRDRAELSFYKVGHTIFYSITDIDRLILKNKVI